MSTPRNPVGWFEIYVQDMPRAKAFYETVFKVTLQHLEGLDLEMWAFPMLHDQSGCTGALVKMTGKDSGVGGTIVYFVCEEDCAIEADRAKNNGGKIIKDKFPIGPHGFICLVTDTEGNMIGLHSMK